MEWPRYRPDADGMLLLNVRGEGAGGGRQGVRTVRGMRGAQCDFWDAHLPPAPSELG